MDQQTFTSTAMSILQDYGLSEDVSAAITGMTIQLEKSKEEKNMALKTKSKRKREKRDLAIYRDYQEYLKDSESDRSEIVNRLMKKYGIKAHSTIYAIIHRVDEKLQIEGNE